MEYAEILKFFTIEEILISKDEINGVKENCEGRRHILEILKKLEIYEIFCSLFKRGNDFCINENGKQFIIKTLDFYKTKAGKALRKNDFPTLNIYKQDLIELLNLFDESIKSCVNERKSNSRIQIWFHNTFYYSVYIILPEIERIRTKIKLSKELQDSFNSLYYLSATQKLELMKDIEENETAFYNEGVSYLEVIDELAYVELEKCADKLEEDSDYYNICDIIQVIDTNKYEFDSKYIKLKEEISEIEKSDKINLSDLSKIKNKRTQLLKIKDSYLYNNLKNYFRNSSAEVRKSAERIYHKYICKDKLENLADTIEDSFIAHYGVTDYSVLKQEVLKTCSFTFIK